VLLAQLASGCPVDVAAIAHNQEGISEVVGANDQRNLHAKIVGLFVGLAEAQRTAFSSWLAAVDGECLRSLLTCTVEADCP
jgi:hypothetical protein